MRCDHPVFGRRIDFLAHRQGVPSLYVEAKSPSSSQSERLASRYRGEVMDLLKKHRAPGYFVAVELSGTPTRPVPMRRFRLASRLKRWCDGLDRARSLERRRTNPRHVETFEWPPEESYLEVLPEVALLVEATPMAEVVPFEYDGFAHTSSTDDAFIYCPDLPIADAIAEKATGYGDLALPYIIAVNVSDFAVTRAEALRGVEAGIERAGPRARELVSGVLLAYVPNIAAAVAMAPVLWVNPHARRPLGVHAKFFRPLQGQVEARIRRS